MHPVVFQKRAQWTAIVACSCSIWCAVLVDKTAATQIPNMAELRLIALPVPSAVDLLNALPTSQTTYITGDTFFIELWAQTDASEGLVQASADVSFNPAVVTGVNVTHTAVFDIFPAGTIDNVAGIIDNLSGSHTPVEPPCSNQVGFAPQWARVATVEMRARSAAITPIDLLDANDLFFVVATCNSLVAVSPTFVGLTLNIQAPQADVRLVALPVASTSGLSTTLPLSQSGFPLGVPFVLELWTQTDSLNGLAQVSADIAFDSTIISAGTITHSALFNLFTSGSINNFTGIIDNLSGAHPPVIPSCSDSVGTTPNWVRMATVSMSADAIGTSTVTSADANDLIFVMAVCGSEVAPVTTFGGVAVDVTLCGNGILEAGEDCDDGNFLAGDCCSPTCTFEPVTTVCRSAVDGCDADEFCDGAGACPLDTFQPLGTACGNPTNTVCDAADTCDGSGACQANIAPTTTECRAIAGDCDVAEFCDGLGACPIDNFLIAGTACGNPASSICDNPDICDGNGTCSPDFSPTTVLCRVAVDVCDVDEFCDGAGACPTNAFQVAGAACGDPANTVCDNPDSCDGTGFCQANLAVSTVVCRAPISDCDVTELCDGLGRCPLDQFLALGTTCGNTTSTVCDNPDSCDASGNCLSNPKPSTVLCRTAVDACDVDDFCDGAGSCSVDAFQPTGTSCGNPTVTVCDAADTCNGAGTCQANFEPTTLVCRSAAPDCDVAEFCNGAGSCPVDTFEPLGTACGNPSGTTCDNPDSCDAAGVCLPNLEPSTTACRLAVGDCDATEQCDGLGACPVDAFQAAGLACGNPSNTVCDNPDTCDGAGTCQPNFDSILTSCRLAVDVCDTEDFCNGAGSCSPDAFQLLGTPCGNPTATVCDGPDTCDGAGACQQNLEPVTTICRATGGMCDVNETCDGAGQCPADAKLTSECRASAGECDVAEFCDGITNSCPVDSFMVTGTFCGDPTNVVCNRADTCNGSGTCLANIEPSTTICRMSIGDCDLAELCDGLGLCPADLFEFTGTPCGDPTNTICNIPDSCDGTGSCLSNFALPTTSCRVAAGVCDAEEFCDGVGQCPTDAKLTSECRASAGECDVAELCDGVTNSCPVDAFVVAGTFCGDPTNVVCNGADTCDGAGVCLAHIEPSTTICRTSIGDCDLTELCDGLGQCPADVFKFAGTACGDPTNTLCNIPDSCDGVGTCLSNFELPTTSCRVAANACDAEEFCDGAGNCPIDGFQALGSACGNPAASLCDGPDTCDGLGVCDINNVVNGTSCSDGLFCNGVELCQTGACQPDTTFCVDACEHCTEAAGVCAWCVFDHNQNSVMDGFDFSFFSGCFGSCFLPADACIVANYDQSPDGCIGGGDFGAFSGCFSLNCNACAGCSGPQPSGGSSSFMATSSLLSSASVQLIAVQTPRSSDVSALLPRATRSFLNDKPFSVEVWATHTANSYDGFGSVYVDVSYDPSLLVVDDIVPSDSFSLFSRGSADASTGLITAIGGCAPVGEGTLGSQSNWVRVATLRVRALDVGYATVTAKPSYGPFGVSVFGRFGDLPSQQIEFGSTELRIQQPSTVLPKRGMRLRTSR